MQSEHEEDVDMDSDGPEISTLGQDETPPPPRLRLKLNLGNAPRPPMPPSSDPEDGNEEEAEEEEEEEDQLIDDDSDMPIAPSNLPATSSVFILNPTQTDDAIGIPQKGKRKRSKPSKRVEDEAKQSNESFDASGSLRRRSGPRGDAGSIDPPLEEDDIIDLEDSTSHIPPGRETEGQGEIPPLRIPASSSKMTTKKRGGARKTGTASSGRGRGGYVFT
jgi:hypothetical protein